MLERYRRWRRQVWDERSHVERMEFQSLLIVRFMVWFFFAAWLVMPVVELALDPTGLELLLGSLLLLCAGAQCVVAWRLLPLAFDQYLGRGTVPGKGVLLAGALMTGTLALDLALEAVGGLDHGFTVFVALFAVIPYTAERCLVLPLRTYQQWSLAAAVVVPGAFALAGVHDMRLLGYGLGVYGGAMICLASIRCSAWSLRVMWQAEQGREAQARLAVAEERLRFGRDLHDVMGRNLAVIALKSELAVQLARRGRPEAVEQMIEVQRIAQESQKEVREVVRGYREASLGSELAGAQAVLTAAGIDCRVTGAEAAGELPTAVHAALGWVVREAATNVLRHGDASRCEVALRVAEGRAVLTVESDGAGGVGQGARAVGEGVRAVGQGVRTAGQGARTAGVTDPSRPGAAPAPQGYREPLTEQDSEGFGGRAGGLGSGAGEPGRSGRSGSGSLGSGVGSGGSGAGGFGSGAGPGGSGLAGLRERLAVLGGRLEAGPAEGGMFRLRAEVPLGVPESAAVAAPASRTDESETTR
ncbi:sensor histidine kinase [Streptomyces indicus]|uniref:Two-component system, NarL family, sensor histidine kinase DesK n=1 Tax=Streptomyces indicus TaxID=417292 RepID=A0A1G9IF74_9ACTN|nr:histidine kinase [Streptomyces indicus]SDL23493.1 two-component system, NarL family, sensor histidine kinase DesK [Streptomyces indicus]